MGARPLHGSPLSRRARPGTAALALAAAGLAACGGGVDSAQVEDEIQDAIEERVGGRVASVSCPDDLEAEAGDTFQCTARGPDGGEAVVLVRQTDDDGTVRFTTQDLSHLR